MEHFKKWFLCFFVIFNICFDKINCKEKSYATSVVGMAELLKSEEKLVQATFQYIYELEEKLKTIKSIIEDLREKHNKVGANAEEYVSNPLHSFPLIRRMHADWPKWLKYAKKPIKSKIFDLLTNKNLPLPTQMDVTEAVEGLQRIQFYYKMNPIYLAEGIYQKQGNGVLSCVDLHLIGKELLSLNMSADAILWLEAAVMKCSQRTPAESYLDKEIHKFSFPGLHMDYAFGLARQDNLPKSLEMIKLTLQHWPFSKVIWSTKVRVEELIEKSYNYFAYENSPDYNAQYVNHCRRLQWEEDVKSIKNHKLHCYYNTTKNAFYKLAPFKMEQLSLDPYAVIYHDILQEHQIQYLKLNSSKKLKRAKLGGKNRWRKQHVSKDRTCQTNFWNNNQPIIKLISYISGLNMDGFENMSVVNYGIGGHYAVHYDHITEDPQLIDNKIGNRMATAMIYLSDVDYGGSTVFPYINLSIHPRKGSILFWYNLNNNGESNVNAAHGACPVILGSKWIATIWIRERAQLLHAPCYNP